jgi:hypothetical protein
VDKDHGLLMFVFPREQGTQLKVAKFRVIVALSYL